MILRPTISGCALALLPLAIGAPALAQTAEAEAATIMELLTFDGMRDGGIFRLGTEVEDCVFLVTFDGEEDGFQVKGSMTGDLTHVTAANITLQPTDTWQELYFLLPGPSSAWNIELDIDTANPLYAVLNETPETLPHINAECGATGCRAGFDLGGDWDDYEMNVDLTDMVTDAEADQLLASFQNLANLCN